MIKWNCVHTWKQAAYNTSFCLIGCSIGDFGTLAAFQAFAPHYSISAPLLVAATATFNGIGTSIALESFILKKSFFFFFFFFFFFLLFPISLLDNPKMSLKDAVVTASGMSLISMIGMETAMNATDYLMNDSITLSWMSLGPSLLAGFLAPLPYNYWRLKKHGKSCH